MEKILEWCGSAGKVALAIGVALGAAIGVAAIILDRYRNRDRQRQDQYVRQHPGMGQPAWGYSYSWGGL